MDFVPGLLKGLKFRPMFWISIWCFSLNPHRWPIYQWSKDIQAGSRLRKWSHWMSMADTVNLFTGQLVISSFHCNHWPRFQFHNHRSTMVQNGKKHRKNSHPIIHFPTSEWVSEMSERVRAAERASKASSANKRTSMQCEQMSKWKSKWPSTFV